MKKYAIFTVLCCVFAIGAFVLGYRMGIEKGFLYRMKLESTPLHNDFTIYADRERDPQLKAMFEGQRDSYKLISDSVKDVADPPNVLLPNGLRQ
jgi:hypothetical protein